MTGYDSIEDHRGMVYDKARNHHYRRALENIITPDSVVLDLGAGMGVLGLIAAQCGARKVYMVDPASILEATREAFNSGPHADQVECIRGTIEEVDLPEKVDVLLSVFSGNFLVSEDLLPSLFYARNRFLKPGGLMLPDNGVMSLAPVDSVEMYKEYVDCWSTDDWGGPHGLWRGYAANSAHHCRADKYGNTLLAEPASFNRLDFTSADQASFKETIDIEVITGGYCHGLLGWFSIRIGKDWLSTGPNDDIYHWRQVFLPLSEPLEVSPGQTMRVGIQRPDFGEWTWSIEIEGHRQRQSTFLSAPHKMSNMVAMTAGYCPSLSTRGELALEVLDMMDGHHSIEAIAAHIQRRNPKRYFDERVALLWVQNLIEDYGL